MDILPCNNDWNEKLAASEKDNKNLLSELCRLCGNASGDLIPIFEGEGLENNLGAKIERHLPYHVLEDDNFPQHVCLHCARTVLSWHDITENILAVEEKFRSILRHMGLYKDFHETTEVTGLAALGFSENGKESYYNNATTERNVPSGNEIMRLPLPARSRKPAKQNDLEWTKRECGAEGVEDNTLKCDAMLRASEIALVCECAKCGSSFREKEDLLTHMTENHLDHTYRCYTCDRCFKAKVELEDHIKSAHSALNKKWHTSIPPEKNHYVFGGTLPADHSYCAGSLRKEGENGNYVHDECGDSFSRKQDLQRFSASHTREDRENGCESGGASVGVDASSPGPQAGVESVTVGGEVEPSDGRKALRVQKAQKEQKVQKVPEIHSTLSPDDWKKYVEHVK